MPHEILQLGPWEISVAMLCMGHGLAATEREASSIADRAAAAGSLIGVVPVYPIGGV